MVSLHELKRGLVYTFYEKRTPIHNEECYRGRFLEIREIGKETEKKYKYIYIIRDLRIGVRKAVTICPFEWIVRVENLDETIKGRTKLPKDAVDVIDEFL
jgi:hypothetical protein